MKKTTAKKLWINKLYEELEENLDAWVTDWGSFQYAPARAWYIFALQFLKEDRALFEESFGISYTRQIETEDEYVSSIKEELLESAREEMDYYTKEMDTEEIKEIAENIEEIQGIQSIAGFYEYAANNAWDLWSAALNAGPPLINFKYEPVKTNSKKTGFLINDQIMESCITGITLAYTTHIFGTPEMELTANGDFST